MDERTEGDEAADYPRREVDLGFGCRVLDVSVTWSRGLLVGSCLGFWTALMLGLSAERATSAPALHRLPEAMTRPLMAAILIASVLAVCLGNLRAIGYVFALARVYDANEDLRLVEYQAEHAFRKAIFGSWSVLAWVLIGIGAFMALFLIALMADNDTSPASSIAMAAATVGIGGGWALIRGVRALRRWRDRRLTVDFSGRRTPRPKGARRVPSDAGANRRLRKLRRILVWAAIIPPGIGLGVFIVWGLATDQVTIIGGRVRTLPGSSGQGASDSTAGDVVSTIAGLSSAWAMVLAVVIVIVGAVEHQRAMRVLLHSVRGGDSTPTHPRARISASALTPKSVQRRTSFLAASAGVLAFVVAVAPPEGTPVSVIGSVFAVATVLLLLPPVLDVLAEPRHRRERNELLATWDSAAVTVEDGNWRGKET